MSDNLDDFLDVRSVHVLPSGCQIWMRQTDKDGYALANIKIGGKFKTVRVARLTCERAHGEAKGRFACHRCDTPSCINPEHLFWGTHTENMKDRSVKSRSSRHALKIDDEIACKIFQRYSQRARSNRNSASNLANEFGVSRNGIYKIVKSMRWAK